MYSGSRYKRKRSYKTRSKRPRTSKTCVCSLAKLPANDVTNNYPPLYRLAGKICNPNQVVNLKRSTRICTVIQAGSAATVNTIASLSSGWSENNFYFQVNSFTGMGYFLDSFDQYRVIKVVLTLIPRVNVNDHTLVAAQGTLLYAQDYDNASAFGSANDDNLRAFGNSKELSAMRTVHIPVAPCRKVTGVDVLGVSQSSQGLSRDWQDCSYATTPYYGIRTMISPTNSAGDITYDARVTMYIQFKNPCFI